MCHLKIDLQDFDDGMKGIARWADKLEASTLADRKPLSPLKAEELIRDAEKLVRDLGRCGSMMLQRRLHIGYNRSLELMDNLENRGIISTPDKHGTRTVLVEQSDVKQRF